jgi:hypothetical protein
MKKSSVLSGISISKEGRMSTSQMKKMLITSFDIKVLLTLNSVHKTKQSTKLMWRY